MKLGEDAFDELAGAGFADIGEESYAGASHVRNSWLPVVPVMGEGM